LDFSACDVYDLTNSYTSKDLNMRTNIVIDDKLMADVMALGGFKTKREAVEEGLRMIKRRKAYDALLAARGTLHWDDSEAHWAQVRAERVAALAAELAHTSADAASATAELAVHEPAAPYNLASQPATKPARKPRVTTPIANRVTKRATKGASA
jgi:Arc/MetJ family transcription regulator